MWSGPMKNEQVFFNDLVGADSKTYIKLLLNVWKRNQLSVTRLSMTQTQTLQR